MPVGLFVGWFVGVVKLLIKNAGGNRLYITNGKIVLPDKIMSSGSVVVKGKKIVAISDSAKKYVPKDAARIDAQRNFIAPGFIDLHIHGQPQRISCQQAQGGSTGFLLTLHPAPIAPLLKSVNQALVDRHNLSGAKILGLRLEGPFLNPKFAGALSPAGLRLPNCSEMNAIINQARGALKMVVVAPELPGALSLIRMLKRKRIVASIGHSGASYEQARSGIDSGITHATHTFNRMGQFDHRKPGALGAVLTDKRLGCEVIADSVHVHPAALSLLLACKGADKVMLITDSTQAQQLPVKKRQGLVYRLPDGTLYGTALTLNKAVKNTVRLLGLNLPEAVRLVTLNPAQTLRLDKTKGSLAVGKDADLVIFDKNFNVKMTIVEGKVVYTRN